MVLRYTDISYIAVFKGTTKTFLQFGKPTYFLYTINLMNYFLDTRYRQLRDYWPLNVSKLIEYVFH